MLKTCCGSEKWIKVPILRTKTVVANKEMIPTTCRQFIVSIEVMFPAQNGQMKLKFHFTFAVALFCDKTGLSSKLVPLSAIFFETKKPLPCCMYPLIGKHY